MRALGLDVGSKTIGVALSDALGLAAHSLAVIARSGMAADVAEVERLVRANDVQTVVVGLPLQLDGTPGHRARRVRVLTDALRQRLAVVVEEWDERFSTAAVERVLVAGNVSRKRRKQVIDQQAATYILQGWLDFQRDSKGPLG